MDWFFLYVYFVDLVAVRHSIKKNVKHRFGVNLIYNLISLNVSLEKILYYGEIQYTCCLFVQVICKVSRGTVEDVNRAVEAAKVCFPRFSTILL